jgi:hypothetical protein
MATEKSSKKSWRDVVKVHPAADVFPRMTQTELQALGEDIARNGLRVRVIIGLDPETGEEVLLDGRNRLDAMELVGERVLKNNELDSYVKAGALIGGFDPAAVVIGANIRRRHLTKQQQAQLIVAAVKAVHNGTGNDSAKVAKSKTSKKKGGDNDSAKVARSFNPTAGTKGGSTKDPVKTQAVAIATGEGISVRTVENALAADKDAEIMRLLEQGVKRDDICKQVQCNPNRVSTVKKRMHQSATVSAAPVTDTPAAPARKASGNRDRWAKGTLHEIEELDPSSLTDPDWFGRALMAQAKRFTGKAV